MREKGTESGQVSNRCGFLRVSRSKLFGGGERGRGRSLSVFAECIRSRQGVNSAFPIADKTQRACVLQTKYTRTCTHAHSSIKGLKWTQSVPFSFLHT